jgi:sec-independent protein translocase protein TatB
MFDVSFTELLLIALVALIVLGPQRLPEVARTAGQWVGKLRRFVSEVKSDFDREMNQAELAELRKLKAEIDDTRRVMEDASQRFMQDVNPLPAGSSAEPASTPSLDSLMPPPGKPVGSEHVIGTPLATKPLRASTKRSGPKKARRAKTASKPKTREPHGRAPRSKRR